MDNDFYAQIPNTLLGIPGISEIRKWRLILEEKQGPSSAILVGIQEGPDGEILGIFRYK